MAGNWFVLALGSMLFVTSFLSAVDCNRNGAPDSEDIASLTSVDCDLDGVPDECEFASLRLGLLEEGPAVTDRTRDAVAADFNGDGRADIALGAMEPGGSSSLFVLLSSANHSFVSPVEYPAGMNLTALATVDCNDDDAMDVAATNGDAVLSFLNQGDGTLAPPVRLSTTGTPELLDVADLTGDGRADWIVVTSPERTVEVLAPLENGTFQALGPFPFEARPDALATADLDNDGDVDVVVLSRSAATASLFLNAGDGVLSPPIDLDIPGRSPVDMVTADLNSDGSIDLAAATLRGIVILFGAGDASFPTQSNLEVSPSTLTTTDINADGAPDLATGSASSSLVSLFVNNGNGAFGSSAINSSMRVTWRPGTVSPADLDGDGDVDIAVTDKGSENINVLWNAEVGVATAGLTRRGPVIQVGFKPHAAVQGDFNDDGIPDVATANGDGQNVSILVGTGTGGFEEPTVENGRHYFFEGSGHLNHITTGDLDGDGDLDLAAVEQSVGRVGILSNHGDGTFDVPVRFPAGTRAYHIQTADLDADGDLDLAVANAGANTASLHYNAGNGSFPDGETLSVENLPESLTLADLDGDGDIDVAVGNKVSSSVSLFFRSADGTYSRPPSVPTLGTAITLTNADFDADGDSDLVTVNANEIEVFLNDASESLARGGLFPHRASSPPFSVTAADMNADGFPDVLTANFFARTVSVLLGRGDGSFHLPYVLTAGQVTRAVVVGDFDRDGDLDALAANRVTEDATVFANELQRTNVPNELPGDDCGERLFRRGDSNGDGQTDLSDALFLLEFLFRRGPASPCPKSADVNDSGGLDVLDAIDFVDHLFRGGVAPTEPFATCGTDLTEDRLRCDAGNC
jgi:hypothetical protein